MSDNVQQYDLILHSSGDSVARDFVLGDSTSSITILDVDSPNPEKSSMTTQESDQEETQEMAKAVMSNDFELKQPLNYTDPFVYHDPKVEKSSVAKVNEPENKKDHPEELGNENTYDTKKVEGIKWPVIKVNNIVVRREAILNMEIDYTGFYPILSLSIYDFEGHIAFADVPGPNNVITVVMVPALQDVYKSISLDFYINDVSFDKESQIINYTASYKFLPLEQKMTAQLKYPGCTSHLGKSTNNGDKSEEEVSCNQEQQAQPNTWEYLHMICLDTGLGFASTDNVKDVQDRLPRIVNNMNYREYIQSQIEMSGVDEKSMFDCWIDLYRYLVIVNVYYEMNEKISFRQLGINASLGIDGTEDNAPKTRTKLVHRTLTNYTMTEEPNDLTFKTDNFKEVVDNSLIFEGYDQQTNVMPLKGCDNTDGTSANSIQQVDHKIEINSLDGKERDDYATIVVNPCTVRVDESYNTNVQRVTRDNFFMKLRSHRYEVILDKPNFGLNRGTIVNLCFFTSKASEKQMVLQEPDNAVGSTEGKIEKIDTKIGNSTPNDLIRDETAELPVFTKSGFYYIDGMKFMYDSQSQEILQKLILIRREFEGNFVNKMSAPKLDGDALGSPEPTTPVEGIFTTKSDATVGEVSFPFEMSSSGSEYSERNQLIQTLSKRIQGYDQDYDYMAHIGSSQYLLSDEDRANMSSMGISFDELVDAYKPTDEDKKWWM